MPTVEKAFNNNNINYLTDEPRFTISAKFHQTLPSISSIPTFSPTKVNDWKDRLKSWLRSCHSLDHLIRDQREMLPVQVDSETVEEFEKRLLIFKARDRAFFLILDKSLSSATNLDPKFLALSEQLSLEEDSAVGQKLYDGILFLLKGSHLWSRIDSLASMWNLQLERIGNEQMIYNQWKREADIQAGLQLDLAKIQKLMLINALNHRKEHKTVMLQLAAMNPDELFGMTSQAILERFIASAGHIGPSKDLTDSVALLAEPAPGAYKRKMESTVVSCFFCKGVGHLKKDCPKFLASNSKKRFYKKKRVADK
jgi:hypothetical protein